MKHFSILFLLLTAVFSVSLISCLMEPDAELTVPEVTLTLSEKNPQTSVIISWTKSNDAEEYSIKRSFIRDDVTEWHTIYKGDFSVLTFEDNTLETGVEYTYIVTAHAARQQFLYPAYFSEESEPKTITTDRNPLQTLDFPKNLTVQEAEDDTNALTLKWDVVEGADTYEIYRCLDNSGKTELLASIKETSYTVYHLYNLKKYEFKIKAVNGENFSLFSSEESGRVAEAENLVKSKAYLIENGVTENFYSSKDTLWFKCTPQKGIITIFNTYTFGTRNISATVFTEDGKVLATGLSFTFSESTGYKDVKQTFNDFSDFCPGATYYISITDDDYGDISFCVE